MDAPSKPDQHAADLYIKAMEAVEKDDIPQCVQMMQQRTKISSTETIETAISSEGGLGAKEMQTLEWLPNRT